MVGQGGPLIPGAFQERQIIVGMDRAHRLDIDHLAGQQGVPAGLGGGGQDLGPAGDLRIVDPIAPRDEAGGGVARMILGQNDAHGEISLKGQGRAGPRGTDV